jgi:hypothetical protein
LGEPVSDKSIATRLDELESEVDFRKAVMIGGPPCQAYSLVGRSRMAKARASGAYREGEDGRHVLYRQYLKLIQRIQPAAFVMENVRGILSSRYQDRPIFQQILDDLSGAGYDLHALGDRSEDTCSRTQILPRHGQQIWRASEEGARVHRRHAPRPPDQGTPPPGAAPRSPPADGGKCDRNSPESSQWAFWR